MKRVAIIFPNYAVGGAETVTNMLAEALRTRGFEFVLVTSGSKAEVKSAAFSEVLALDFLTSRYDPTVTARLAEALQPLNIDIIWLAVDELAAIRSLRKALSPGGKIIYHLHGVPFYQATIKAAYHDNPNNPVAIAKWFFFKHLRENLFKSYTRRYIKRTRQTASDVDSFITLSEGYTRELVDKFPEYAAKFQTIHNPIAESGDIVVPEKKTEILYLGRLTRADKHPDLLLKIFAKVAAAHPQWTLKIVGDGPEREHLERLAKKLHIDRQTQFTGFTSTPAEHLATASILCLTSKCESWGMVLIEAMQYGVTPVAFNCSAGVEEVLSDGRGILVPPGKINTYADEVNRLIDNPKSRQQICSNHADFIKSLSIKNIVTQWEKLLQNQ
ncbi:MAG: glycosyltransferase [Bacteroides sp.]|nr:glycosyltransferase [Bacteroides sp.]MCM1378595.1 glycosyltransferase [Bacteroides sp.]MCM1444896.1 glycosyltransferase [Prevotella sp.]